MIKDLDYINKFQAVAVVLGGALGFFFGKFDGFVYALTAFICIDYITGVIKAVIQRKVSSEVGLRGIMKKVLIFGIVGMGHVMDEYILLGQDTSVIRTAVILFYLSNEGISIIENTADIGLPIPEKLRDVLLQLREKRDKKEEKDEKDTNKNGENQ